MEQIQANRLIGVLNMLETLPKQARFNINNWANGAGRTSKPTLKKAMNCGTSACAVGWAVLLVPAWRKQFNFRGQALATADRPRYEMGLHETYEAVGEFVGLNMGESQYLFAPDTYSFGTVTPAMVAERIINTLDDHGYSAE